MSREGEFDKPAFKFTVEESIQELNEYIRRFRVDCYEDEWACIKHYAELGWKTQHGESKEVG